jgi:hypothetical protein
LDLHSIIRKGNIILKKISFQKRFCLYNVEVFFINFLNTKTKE